MFVSQVLFHLCVLNQSSCFSFLPFFSPRVLSTRPLPRHALQTRCTVSLQHGGHCCQRTLVATHIANLWVSAPGRVVRWLDDSGTFSILPHHVHNLAVQLVLGREERSSTYMLSSSACCSASQVPASVWQTGNVAFRTHSNALLIAHTPTWNASRCFSGRQLADPLLPCSLSKQRKCIPVAVDQNRLDPSWEAC